MVDVTISGPLFDGQVPGLIDAFLDEAKTDVAQKAVDMIRTELQSVLKNPTGFYESNIQAERAQEDILVTDNDVVYGSWLEGTSSRNESTRFKGYSTFRRTIPKVEDESTGLVADLLVSYVRRMNE